MNYKNIIKSLSVVTVAAIMTTGCVGDTENLQTAQTSLQKQIKTLENDNTKKDEQINALKAELSKSSTKDEVQNEYILQQAKPGECFAKVKVPAKYEAIEKTRLVEEEKTRVDVTPETYKVVDKKVQIRESRTKLEVIPATYKTVTEQIVAEPESSRLVVVPATYKTVTEEIMVSPKSERIINIPETYKIETEKVLVTPAHTEWKKGRGEIEKVDNGTGEIMCLVEVPATYKTVQKKVIASPATTKKEIIPAVYKTVTKRVIATPETTKEIKIPAVYKTITRKVVATPASTREVKIPGICKMVKTKEIATPASSKEIKIPAVYETYTVKKQVEDSYLKWQPILCETNTKAGIVSELQQTLIAKGYKIKSIDGVYGKETQNAVAKYQQDNKLAQGALTIETLKSLGLK